MGSTLTLYFLRNCTLAFCLICLALVALFSIFELIDEFESVGVGDYQTGDALLFVAMSVPKTIVDMASLICFLGTFLVFAQIGRTNELLAMRCAGVSHLQLVAISLLAAVLALVALICVEWVGRGVYQDALIYREAKLSGVTNMYRDKNVWLVENQFIVNIEEYLSSGDSQNIHVIELGQEFRIDSYTFARQAVEKPGGSWILKNGMDKVFRARAEGANVPALERFITRPWTPPWNPVKMLFPLPVDSLTLPELASEISAGKSTQDDVTAYATQFWSRVALPLHGLAFSFFAVMFSLSREVGERDGLGRRMLMGTLLSLALYILTQLTTNAGLVLGVHQTMALATPALLVIVLSFAIFFNQQGSWTLRTPATQ